MLKTLKLASYLAVVLAVCGIGTIIVLGTKGDPEVREYLTQPSITMRLKEQFKGKKATEEKVDPLVAQAKALALRFDPPPPPPPPKPKVKPTPPKPAVARDVPKPPPAPPTPKVQQSVRFTLLGTVMNESLPEQSLALLMTTGNKQEWFRQGEKLGHHEIKEIRDGSVIFTQGGKKPQEIFIPPKPQVKSLLKNGKSNTNTQQSGQNSILVQQGAAASVSLPTPAVKGQVTEGGKIRVTRSTATSSRTEPSASARIQRARKVPQPTAAEQKKSIESSISGIKDIINRTDYDLPEEEKKKEQESFKQLLELLSAENKRLEEQARKEAVGREKPKSEETEDNIGN